jgi:rhodanese-related sulfurtransferase
MKPLLNTILFILFLTIPSTLAYNDITPEEVHTRLAEGDTLLLLDVREISEYWAGHISEPTGMLPVTPVNMPWNSNVLSTEYNRLPTDIDIIVYCQSGGRSALASAFLESQGFTRIYNMPGGFSSWIYEYRENGFGDQTGKWVSSSGTDPVIITCTESMDTSKIIFPVNALPGTDSIYIELHFASPYVYVPPNVPQSDLDGLFRVTALDPFGLPLFTSDCLVLSDTAEIILIPEFHGNIVFYPELKVFIPGEEWQMVSSNFVLPAFYRNETVLRKWYNGEGFLTTDVIAFNSQPENFELHVFPNPFNPSTKIRFTISQSPLLGGDGRGGSVKLKVYDLLGNKVATLVNEELPVGDYEVEFDANGLASGIYLVRMQADDFIVTKKMILMK